MTRIPGRGRPCGHRLLCVASEMPLHVLDYCPQVTINRVPLCALLGRSPAVMAEITMHIHVRLVGGALNPRVIGHKPADTLDKPDEVF